MATGSEALKPHDAGCRSPALASCPGSAPRLELDHSCLDFVFFGFFLTISMEKSTALYHSPFTDQLKIRDAGKEGRHAPANLPEDLTYCQGFKLRYINLFLHLGPNILSGSG